MPLVAIALVGALILGGGVSIAAQQALPGNPLYPIKININENIEGAFALSNQARADWDTKLVQARLTEATQLANEGKLTTDAQAAIDNNFDSHTYDLGVVIARLRAAGDETGAAQAAAKFKTALVQQAVVLESSDIAANNVETHAALVPVVAEVQSALGAAALLSSSTPTTAK